MGRGQQQATVAAPSRSKSKNPAPAQTTIQVGQVWVNQAGRELEVLQPSAPNYAHLCLLVRDKYGVAMIEPVVLLRDYRQKAAAPPSAAVIDFSKPKRDLTKPKASQALVEAPVTLAQEGYLKRLYQEAGEEATTGLTKDSASKEIDRLKLILGQ